MLKQTQSPHPKFTTQTKHSYLSTPKSPQVKSQEIPSSFEAIIERLNQKSFNLNRIPTIPLSPPESVCDDSDFELEFEDEERDPPFDHKTDPRVRDYHNRLYKRYNGMMCYFRKQSATYWKSKYSKLEFYVFPDHLDFIV
ncbi:hypothetical protein K493DRAFT_344958 [Basidiobolus meristosporus CBS 931.73]|uniref:Uncharacterized protein n=1 Tax=Basidiobolus meristosporus CBS 931.73 TaxID=1314790 RepID=A0A1Y1Z5I1_9FUNG|nr:hypothetical protein K493DRAFT_344958 [Basidiobolus meristosporus CBS 931.73]|eukprot:ORY05509.1 hypothetical protein K493DRAFT_344958 [Basidiobolus meristosporus CBS 931.73]